jgi:hypothetical protein
MSSPHAGWLKKAMAQQAAPKESVIGVLKKAMGGVRPGRDRSLIHASDITRPEFCPRQWAFHDLQGLKAKSEYLSVATAATYDIGNLTARTLIERWAGEYVVGNWECERCEQWRTLTTNATVLYVSRGHGKANPDWKKPSGKDEVLPFKEFHIERDDEITKPPLQKAKALKIFRETAQMPTGICATALDKYAKTCDCCKICFSGDYKPQVHWANL